MAMFAIWFRPNFGISAWFQRERWLFSVIQPTAAHNVTAAVEFLFQPRKLFPRSHDANKP